MKRILFQSDGVLCFAIIVLFLTLATSSVSASLFVLHKEDTSTTSGWKVESGSGTLSNSLTRVRLSESAGTSVATKQSQFFF